VKHPKVASRWIKTKADEQAVADGCYFENSAADRVCMFFERFLCLSKGQWSGEPFKLMDWQRKEVLMPMFGWKRSDGTRRFRVGYVEIPKKNGKSGLCSGLSLYLLCADGEPGAEVYSVGADRQQASIVFNESASMVRNSPQLSKRMEVIDSRKTIAYPTETGTFRALAADSDSNEGLNIHGLIFDELHAQKSPRLWDALRYGGAARRQPLMIAITTAGVDRNSIAWEQHDYAAKILDGTIVDTSFFAYIRAASPDDDWTKPETWRKANPSMGITINEADFAAECKEAQEIPRKENPFKRYRLNLWTEQADRWLVMSEWDACDKKVDAEALAKRECWAGLDLSIRGDLSALVLVFRSEDGYEVLPYFWMPREGAIDKEHRDRVPYLAWERQGLIEITDGNTIDYRRIRAKIKELSEKYVINEIAFDPYRATEIVQNLGDDGVTMVEFRQGFISMNAPTIELERLVRAGKLYHGKNPILRWNAANAVVKTDPAGNIKTDKANANGRIDGVVATIMGIGRAMLTSEGAGRSVYETRGVLAL
jgi:phage terminase large subunit-like protein